MKAFITERFFELDPEDDIIEAYSEYEKEALTADIESFATEHSLSEVFVSRILHQYFIDDKTITREYLRQELVNVGVKGLLVITKLIDSILVFLTDSYNKYTAENE